MRVEEILLSIRVCHVLLVGEKDSKENVHHMKYLHDAKDMECQNEKKEGAKR